MSVEQEQRVDYIVNSNVVNQKGFTQLFCHTVFLSKTRKHVSPSQKATTVRGTYVDFYILVHAQNQRINVDVVI